MCTVKPAEEAPASRPKDDAVAASCATTKTIFYDHLGWWKGGTMPSETYQAMLVRGSEELHMTVIIGQYAVSGRNTW